MRNPTGDLVVTQEEERAEVRTVLSSTLFCRAPTLSRILGYICEQYFEGNAGAIKEYNIAVDALGRGANFHPGDDSIVRVEASRLRRRLRQYYETDGASHPLQIKLSGVGYTPQFIPVCHHVATKDGATAVAAGTLAAAAIPLPFVPEPLPPVIPLSPVTAGAHGQEVPQAMLRPPWRRPVLLTLTAVVIIALLLGVQGTLAKRSSNAAAAAHSAGVAGAAEGSVIRIQAGSAAPAFIDANGAKWLGDSYFLGGVQFNRPAQGVLRTLNQALYQSGREGDFSYAIPLQPGAYELHLHFAETFFGDGLGGGSEKMRLFDVSVNGAPLLSGFDVASDAGGPNVADEKVFRNISPARDGALHLSFSQRRNGAVLSGIEIFPAAPNGLRPIRIVCASHPYYDKQGNLWSADRYFAGGRTGGPKRPLQAVDDVGLHSSSRWGNFTYAIPVADGSYRIRLFFSETVWGPDSTRGGGAGSRLFDIYCNGQTLRSRLDVFREAGGANRALELTFAHLKPNAQNKLVLSFVPVNDYALVSAIEVEDEGIRR
jgi:hypothetical protein